MVYRRGKLRMAGWRLMLAAFWSMAALLAIALFVEIFVLHGWDAGRVAVTFATALLTFGAARAALGAHAWIRPFWTNLVEIDETGIRLRIAGEGEIRVAWPEIGSIKHENRTATTGGFWPIPYRVDDYIVSTTRGPLRFTSMDIPRAKRAAREIAETIGSGAGSRSVRE